MTERNIDIELILAIAEGSLRAHEAAAAEVSLDDAASAELAHQRQALEALSEMSSVALSETERNDLHRELREKLHLHDEVSEPSVAAGRAHQPWYARALPALGAIAALVLVVGIGLNSIGGRNADMAAVSPDEEPESAPDSVSQLSSASDDGSELVRSTEAVTMSTEAAAEETLALLSPTDSESDSGLVGLMMFPDDLGEISLNDPDQLAALVEEGATRVREFAPVAYSDLPEAATQPGLVCWQALLGQETPASEIDYLGTASVDGESGEVYRSVGGDGTVTISVFTGESCTAAATLLP